MKNILSIEDEFKHLKIVFCGIKLRIPHPIDRKLMKEFVSHTVEANTILLVEANNCHKETLVGYYKYLRELGFNVEILLQGGDEGAFCRINEPVKIWSFKEHDLERLLQKDVFKKYERLMFNSKILYKPDEVDIKSVLPKLKSGKKQNIFVQHHIENFNKDDIQIILANPEHRPDLEKFVVNPHYFGEVKITPKNEVVNFITVGELNPKRKNCQLLISAVENLASSGITNFKITVIGRGEMTDIPENIAQYFDIKGRLDFPTMYEEIEDADFFLPLLDPNIEAHKRYLTNGTSGSFQLIYGFLKPAIIQKTFADTYSFSEANSIIYTNNAELAEKMNYAISLNNDTYKTLQNSLNILRTSINKSSKKLLERFIKMN